MNCRMKLFSVSALLLMLIGSIVAEARLAAEPQSCRSRADVVGKCFGVRARLSVYNGTPSIRLWPIGSKRLLGIIDPADTSNSPGLTILPDEIKQKLDWDKDVFGDFVVCPLTFHQPHRMQTVCIESGKDLAVREHKLTGR
jgi:hypothetical protein